MLPRDAPEGATGKCRGALRRAAQNLSGTCSGKASRKLPAQLFGSSSLSCAGDGWNEGGWLCRQISLGLPTRCVSGALARAFGKAATSIRVQLFKRSRGRCGEASELAPGKVGQGSSEAFRLDLESSSYSNQEAFPTATGVFPESSGEALGGPCRGRAFYRARLACAPAWGLMARTLAATIYPLLEDLQEENARFCFFLKERANGFF